MESELEKFGLIDKLEIRIKNEIKNFKVDVQKEIKDEIEVQKGLGMIEKFKVHIKTEIRNFKKEVKEETNDQIETDVETQI